MFRRFTLSKEKTGLLLIDVQERLFPYLDRRSEVLTSMQTIIKGFQILNLPIVITEQYPQGLGHTVPFLRECFPIEKEIFTKTAFSCLQDPIIRDYILKLPISQWVISGVEAHVCVQQTVRDLLSHDKEVVVLNDAITSRSVYDFSTAIAEMRDFGARISSCETVLFELLVDAKSPDFRAISALVK